MTETMAKAAGSCSTPDSCLVKALAESRLWLRQGLGLLTLSLLLVSASVFAQEDALEDFDIPGMSRSCFGMMGITSQQALAVCDALALSQNVRARELAQDWVREQPDSPAAHFALAEVLFRVEGNLPRALFHLNRAEDLTNYTSLGRALDSGNLEWHYLTLTQLSYAHQLIGNQEMALHYLDKIQTIYGQDTESFRGWPLIKLKRYDDARASAEKVLATSNNPRDRSRAWNTLCAVELADLRPQESLAACQNAMGEDQGIVEMEGDDDLDTVHLLNASEVSLSLLQFRDAENFLNRASRRINPDSVGNPWVYKMYLYMNQGRYDEARAAMDNMLIWRESQTPLVGIMNRAEHFMVSGMFLLLAGYPEDAARLSQSALNQPDRTGSYTADEAQKDSIAALVNRMAHSLSHQQKKEEISTLGFFASLRPRFEALVLRFRAWRAGRHAASLFANEETVQNRLRPYAPLDVHIPEWVEPELVSLLGTGFLYALLEQTRADGAFTLNEGYYYAFHVEIAHERGQHLRVLEAGRLAMEHLPAEEVMLKARLAVRLAQAASRLGDMNTALDHYELAIRWDPTVIRRVDATLPVVISADGSSYSRELSRYIRRSPRFTLHEQGLPLEIMPQQEMSMCLRARDGDSLSCVQLGQVDSETGESGARQLMQEFHTQTFSLGYEISRSQRLALLGNSVIFSGQNQRVQPPIFQ